MNIYRVLYTDTRAFYVDVRAHSPQRATAIAAAAIAENDGCLCEDETLMTDYTHADTALITDPDNVIN